MLTLSFGFKQPENGDLGAIVFPALEGNISQLNDHDHDGVNSTKIPSSSLAKLTQIVSAGNFVLEGDDIYIQTLNLPAALTYNSVVFLVKEGVSGDGPVVYLDINKVSDSQYTVRTNDNSKSYLVSYL